MVRASYSRHPLFVVHKGNEGDRTTEQTYPTRTGHVDGRSEITHEVQKRKRTRTLESCQPPTHTFPFYTRSRTNNQSSSHETCGRTSQKRRQDSSIAEISIAERCA